MSRRARPLPSDLLSFEKKLQGEGVCLAAGLDEVGRGSLAGPVVAAAVVLPQDCHLPGVTDSKQLTPSRREELYPRIIAQAVAWHVGFATAEEIDRINIFEASKKAMIRALAGLVVPPQHLLIDGNFRIDSPLPQTPIVKGDSRSLSIAAASIIAKVTRDRWMIETSARYPAFSFFQHKGYGTARHLQEIRANGLTDLHRRSFAPCRDVMDSDF